MPKTIIISAKKMLDDQDAGDFVGSKIGSGYFATVCHIDKVVEITGIAFVPSGYTQPQVLKVQQHRADNSVACLINEITISRKTPHIHPRNPVIDLNKISYTPMEKFPGRELFEIILEDIEREKILTLQQRMELSVAVLEAVLTQVQQCGIIHRDLKPENIRVLESPLTVNIIDYGFSIALPPGKLWGLDDKRCGSLDYMAPEMMKGDGHYYQTEAQDVFSVGRILQVIWGGCDETYNKPKNTASYRRERLVSLENNLFKSLPSKQWVELKRLSLSGRIKTVLQQMLDASWPNRISFKDAR